jgi:VanZ family protein
MNNEKVLLKNFLPGIAWFFVVAVLVFMPGNDVPGYSWMGKYQIDKLVHMGMFGGLVFLFSLPYLHAELSLIKKRNRFIIISVIFIAWGIAVEFIQKYYAYHRGFEISDWVADIIGIVIAYILLQKLAKRRSLIQDN